MTNHFSLWLSHLCWTRGNPHTAMGFTLDLNEQVSLFSIGRIIYLVWLRISYLDSPHHSTGSTNRQRSGELTRRGAESCREYQAWCNHQNKDKSVDVNPAQPVCNRACRYSHGIKTLGFRARTQMEPQRRTIWREFSHHQCVLKAHEYCTRGCWKISSSYSVYFSKCT